MPTGGRPGRRVAWRRRTHRDPWDEALDRHFTSAPGPEAAPPAGGRRSLRLGIPVAVALGIVLAGLVAGTAYLGFIAHENLERADRWRDRANEVQGVLEARTKALNRQTARLNLASERLRGARALLARSERDVAQLEVRQRELAAEKASVEDERAGLERQAEDLEGVAGRLTTCNTGLVTLVRTLADGFEPDPETTDRTVADCELAEAAVAEYVAVHGSE